MSCPNQQRFCRARVAVFGVLIGWLFLAKPVHAAPTHSDPNQGTGERVAAEEELQIGTRLTRAGQFQQAIPHLLAAQGEVSNSYAAEFNLALCYVATRQSAQAIPILTDLRRNHESSQVENLLAQAYIGVG
jgi:thioredoxin-like negative regulator of GroEL